MTRRGSNQTNSPPGHPPPASNLPPPSSPFRLHLPLFLAIHHPNQLVSITHIHPSTNNVPPRPPHPQRPRKCKAAATRAWPCNARDPTRRCHVGMVARARVSPPAADIHAEGPRRPAQLCQGHPPRPSRQLALGPRDAGRPQVCDVGGYCLDRNPVNLRASATTLRFPSPPSVTPTAVSRAALETSASRRADTRSRGRPRPRRM